MSNRKDTLKHVSWKHPLLNIRKCCKYIRKHGKCTTASVDKSSTKLEDYIDEKYVQVAKKNLKEKILNEVKQQFSPSNQGDKVNAELGEA